MSASNGYTPTQRRMLNVLADGLSHKREELFACLWDEQSRIECIQVHISGMRSKLRSKGHDVLFDHSDGTYRIVRMLASPYKE